MRPSIALWALATLLLTGFASGLALKAKALYGQAEVTRARGVALRNEYQRLADLSVGLDSLESAASASQSTVLSQSALSQMELLQAHYRLRRDMEQRLRKIEAAARNRKKAGVVNEYRGLLAKLDREMLVVQRDYRHEAKKYNETLNTFFGRILRWFLPGVFSEMSVL